MGSLQGAAAEAAPATQEDLILKVEAQRSLLSAPVVRQGRAADNDVVLQDNAVSNHHARLEQQGRGAVVVDLNSSNGTFISGQRVPRTPLAGGETMLMGSTQLRFERLPSC